MTLLVIGGAFAWYTNSPTEEAPWNPIPPTPAPVQAPEEAAEAQAPKEPSSPRTQTRPPAVSSPSEPIPSDQGPQIAEPLDVIFVSTPMGIGVSINHTPIGATPLRSQLAPGTYQLTFHDQQAITQEISVDATQKNRWKFDKATQSIR